MYQVSFDTNAYLRICVGELARFDPLQSPKKDIVTTRFASVDACRLCMRHCSLEASRTATALDIARSTENREEMAAHKY